MQSNLFRMACFLLTERRQPPVIRRETTIVRKKITCGSAEPHVIYDSSWRQSFGKTSTDSQVFCQT